MEYGNFDRGSEDFPLASWIWGHRLRDGQDWIEYLLEFLNVLAGFEYKLGKGISSPPGAASFPKEYVVFKRLGLRRFVFYDDKEKTKHPLDTLALKHLTENLRAKIEPPTDEALDQLRSLLRSFSTLERTRSWYAKSLFPAHENLLMWEGLRKGATRKLAEHVVSISSPEQFDADISFTQRNFYARGGELYYLILSAGTARFPERQQTIQDRLKRILKSPYETLGKVADSVEKSWRAVAGEPKKQTIKLGWILDPKCELYERFAEDAECLLQKEIDALELLYLLANLICFHMTVYIYVRAHPRATSAVLNNGAGTDLCRPTLPLDMLNGADGGVVRKVSATQFKLQEYQIEEKAKAYIREKVQAWADEPSGDAVFRRLDSKIGRHFSLGTKSGKVFFDAVAAPVKAFEKNELSKEGLLDAYTDALYAGLANDFRSHFLPIHRTLSKAIGLVSPKSGPNARYTLSDDLLKTLALANLESPVTLDEFLTRLYDRYGIIIGPEAARDSGLYDKQPINIEYYMQNQGAFLEKLKNAGFATEYSDATAMVTTSSPAKGRR